MDHKQLIPRRDRPFEYWFYLREKRLEEEEDYTPPIQCQLPCGCTKDSESFPLRIIIKNGMVYHYRKGEWKDGVYHEDCLLGSKEALILKGQEQEAIFLRKQSKRKEVV